MGNIGKTILNFTGMEIGFQNRKSHKALLPPISGTACQGELIAVVGKNGIGKSTLLRTIAGLQDKLSGELAIDGRSIKQFSRIRLSEKIGYISTETVRVSNLKVYDLVAMGRFPYTNWLGRIKRADDTIINEAIAKTGITGFRDRPVTELSDGERQRAMIAMVLAQDAGIMVMDEPTAFLDISSRFEIMHLLHELTRNRNKSIIFSSHDLNSAMSQADKIWILKETGLCEGAPEDLMLEGKFNTLFADSRVQFNIADGSFSIRKDEKGRISVRGEGEKRYWTEKALIRAGYTISGSESSIMVESSAGLNSGWICRTADGCFEFSTLYELTAWIRGDNPISYNTYGNYQ